MNNALRRSAGRGRLPVPTGLWPNPIVGLAVAAALALTVPATPALAAPDPASCAGVWVVVDAGAGAAPKVGCATSFTTGGDALASAGVAVVRKGNGMICQLDGVPDACVTSATAYWSYWHATRQPDGRYSAWTYATSGADVSRPEAGSVEGWRFGDGSTGPTLAPDAVGAPGAPTGSGTPPRSGFPQTASPGSAASPAPDQPEASLVIPPASTPGPAGLIVTAFLVAGIAGALVAWRARHGRRP